MRLGFYFSGMKPEVGGGFTFQDDILKAILRQAINTPQHEFYLILQLPLSSEYIKNFSFSNNLNLLLLGKYNILDRIIVWLKNSFLSVAQKLKWQGPLEKLAKKNKLDLIWFVGGGGFEIIDTPYIATVWDLQHRLQPWFPELSSNGIWAQKEIQNRYFLSRASYIITGTDVGRYELELFYNIPKFRIYKLPHPTPAFAFNYENKDALNINKKYNIPHNYIFYPAQFWSHKNHINLLQAVKIINKKYQIQLPLVLTGSDKGNLEYVEKTIFDLGLSKQIYLLGFVPQSDLYAFYKNASLLAYVSLCGPENLPPLEAFAAKCPVLASNISGSEEQLGNAVLFCDPKSPDDIAEKIYNLHINNELKKTLVKNGYVKALAWTSDDFVKNIFKMADNFDAIRRNWQ
jgi:glycosyltransferase involved in cell wall biosynthesis